VVGALIFVSSTGLAKVLPLLFGLCLSRLVSPQSYVYFVQVLAQANFLTTLATVSYTQIILSSRTTGDGRDTQDIALRALVFAAIVSIIGGLWAAYTAFPATLCNGNWDCQAGGLTGLCVALYSFGNSVLMIQMSQFNARLKSAHAGVLLICGLGLPYAIGTADLIVTKRDTAILLPIAAALSGIALAAFWSTNRTSPTEFERQSALRLVTQSLPQTREHGYIMLFAALVLYAHAHALTAVNAANNHAVAAVFSLGYQLFAIGLFVPGVLGNLVVPLLRRRDRHSKMGPRSIAVVYLSISLTSMAVVQVFGSYILSWYGLEPSDANRSILLTLQIAVVFASLNAIVNQRLAAMRQYGSMAWLSVVYLLTLTLASYLTGHDAASVAYSVVASYMTTLMMGMAVVRHRRAAPTNHTVAHKSDAAFWSARARKYGHTGWTNQAIYHYDQTLRLKLVKETIESLNIRQGSKCLDYGCGTGDFTRMLSGMGLNVLGYDVSDAVIDVAKSHGVPPNARYTVHADDVATQSPYQLVLAVTVFQHILDDASLHAAVLRVAQCMEDGGHLILIESSIHGSGQSAHVHGRSTAAWQNAFMSSGLRLWFTKSLYHPTLQPTPSFKAYSARPLVRALRVATHFRLPLANWWLRQIASNAVETDRDYFVEGNSPVVMMVWRK